jgi:hypothetical protein
MAGHKLYLNERFRITLDPTGKRYHRRSQPGEIEIVRTEDSNIEFVVKVHGGFGRVVVSNPYHIEEMLEHYGVKGVGELVGMRVNYHFEENGGGVMGFSLRS